VPRRVGDAMLEIRSGEGEKAASALGIDFSRSATNPLPIVIESVQEPGFVASGFLVDVAESVFLDQKRYLASVVMTPKANTMTLGVIAATLIRKFNSHLPT